MDVRRAIIILTKNYLLFHKNTGCWWLVFNYLWHIKTFNENKLTKNTTFCERAILLQLIFKHEIIDERRFFWKNNSVLILMQLYLTNKRIFSIKGIIKLETKPKKIL